MFESPVQSGLLTLRDMDQDHNWSTITIKGQKTGLDHEKTKKIGLFRSLDQSLIKIEMLLNLMNMGHLSK